MATPAMPNGIDGTDTTHGSGMPLTEYSANPISLPQEQPPASASVPPDFLLPNGFPDYHKLILTSRVYDILKETPLTTATNLSNRLECKVLLKREDLQEVFSFKIRGAYNKMAHIDPNDRWKGVVACSAGE